MVAYLSLVGRTKHRDLVVNNQTLIVIKINANDEMGPTQKNIEWGAKQRKHR